jgi:hypothetical protein
MEVLYTQRMERFSLLAMQVASIMGIYPSATGTGMADLYTHGECCMGWLVD